ncbi:hypothetical protein IMZ48_00865 [Candidatus Bathyarchaeota archaeon]|nr:hypothetical protein [Candidatus Bathyarchaeota archaeon]
MLGNPTSTGGWLSTRPFLFPDYSHTSRAVDGWSLCRRPGCIQCAVSPEAATTHIECFELFTRTYMQIDARDRLWRAAAWRKPWREVPTMVLREDEHVTAESVATVAKEYGLPQLPGLPVEIRQIIRSHSESALFWRLTAALDLAAQFHATPTSDHTSVPLRDVTGWERGCLPSLSKDSHHLRIIRITIDSCGIKKLERLPAGEPRYSNRRFDTKVFVIMDEGHFDGVTALFKVLTTHIHFGHVFSG